MNKTSIIAFILIFYHINLNAQQITIKGKVIDFDSKKPVEYATIILQTDDSLFIKGTTSGLNGDFILNNLGENNYRIVVHSVGYDTLSIDLFNVFKAIDLGSLMINQKTTLLSEVIVQSSSVIEGSYRKLYYPTKEQIVKSINGLQLTQRLLLPQIFVNTQTGQILYTGEKKLKILINGIEALSQEVIGIQPENIIRIDYYENPGMRYGEDIGIILDFIVKQRTNGAFFSANIRETLTHNFTYGQLSGGINYGKSQIKFYYFLSHNDIETSSFKHQTFLFPSGNTISRNEYGEKNWWKETTKMPNISYSYYGKKNTFNMKTNFNSLFQPHDDHEGKILIPEIDRLTNYKIQNKEQTFRPSIDIYFTRQISDNHLIALNVVGTYSKNTVDYIYNETDEDEIISNITTLVDGKRSSLIGEIFYERKYGENLLSVGLRHIQGYTKNNYSGTSIFKTQLHDAFSYGFLQYKGKIKKLNYTGNIGIHRSFFNQEGIANMYSRWMISPMVNINYILSNVLSLRYSYQLKNINPSLSYLSEVERLRNSYQLDKGNPLLKSYLMHHNELRISFNPSPLRSSLVLSSSYYNSPIMEETSFDNYRDIFITTYNNQKKFHQLRFQYNIGVSLFNNHISINSYGGYNKIVSQGHNYEHRRDEWFYLLQTIADYKKLSLTITMVHLPQPFWGESVSKGSSYNEYILSYRLPKMQLGIISTNLFGEKNRKYTYNFSALTRFKNMQNNVKMFPSFGIYGSINLTWGKQNNEKKQKINNLDSENGILL
ncbi:carboxypeptidase-like regulatory domain-containing protein [Proteiniphilum propionicum]|uniref:carboxypeptidase-like regulatory domain-containing protein n=1 Tax=Proteiniphilum propionicum TaxID=2829812 RepID=UPI001EEAD6FD|nr:carboxypeptidase-like regulatory domain-containing protein [Proteiniphilum propionicum]ULB34314.1 carboxypeptidase-like regulatory domain-containing protein [Proteiniphilum propionicum]